MASFTGTAGNDTIIPGNVSGGVTVSGSPSDFSAADFIQGLGGNDNLDGGINNDTVDGGDGNDNVKGGDGDDVVRGGSVFSGLDGTDTVNGGAGNDSLEQLGVGDTGLGGSGDDTLNLDEAGADSLDGGTGIDSLFADGLDITGTTITGIENLANNATLTGAQLALFDLVGTSTPTFGTTYQYIFTNTGTVADFTGKIADDTDSFTLLGVNGAATNDRITFDATSTASVFMEGYQGNDTLIGGGGNDDIRGDDGADRLTGGNGADTLYAGFIGSGVDGVDNLSGGAGSDRLNQIGVNDTALGGAGNDTIDIDESGPATLDGGTGTDILVADGLDISSSTITGFEDLWNNARLTGTQLAQFDRVGTSTLGFTTTYTYVFTSTSTIADFTGKVAEDFDNFTLLGVDGDTTRDRITFDAASTASAFLEGYEGDDTLVGGGGNDQLRGDEGADKLTGGDGADFLSGGFVFSALDGADTLSGGNGSDVLGEIGSGDSASGGAGSDTIDIDEVGAVSLDGGSGIDVLVTDSIDISGTSVTGFETLWNGATLTGAQMAQFTTIGASTPGGSGSYTYNFTNTATAVDLTGKLADDFDRFFLNASSTLSNNDRIAFDLDSTASVSINGFGGNDILGGGGGADNLQGADGNDTLQGGGGNDIVAGGAGIDIATYADSNRAVTVNLGLTGNQNTVGAGVDSLSDIENLTGSGLGDTLTGSIGSNTVRGGDGNDSLFGNSGADQLFGEGGADVIEGQGGNDQLTGGSGDDDFVFRPGSGSDTILDFVNGSDQLGIAGFGNAFDTTGEVIAAANQIGGNVQIALSGGVTIIITGFTVGQLNAADFAFVTG